MDGSTEAYMMRHCLEYLKISSLLKYRLYSKEMPWAVSRSLLKGCHPNHSFRSLSLLQTGEEPSALALADFLNLKLNLNGLAIPHWFCEEPVELLNHWLNDFQSTARQNTFPTKVNQFKHQLKILC